MRLRGHPLLKRKGFLFEPFAVPAAGLPLRELHLPGDAELIVFERGGQSRALVFRLRWLGRAEKP